MFFNKKPAAPGSFPAVPPSLNHNSMEMRDSSSFRLPPPPPDTARGVTPYLGLRARLSQIPINRWTVLCLLVLVNVLFTLSSLDENIGDAKTKALSACTKVEDVGSAMASMPHYLSVGVNNLAADGIEKAVSGMVTVIDMILTGVEALIMFVINYFVGTYICLTSALIHGGLDIGIGAADAATKAMNDSINKLVDDLNSGLSGFEDLYNKAVDGINSAGSLFGNGNAFPKLDVGSQVDAFKHINIDDKDFVKTLGNLNNTIPTYDDVEKFANDALSIPFNFVKTAIDSKFGNYTFDRSIFPVAQKEALTFCSGNSAINDFFQGLFELAAKAKIAFLVVLIVLAILACVPMAYMEIRRFRRQQQHARVLTKHGYDPMDVVYIASRPMSATWGIRFASRLSGKRQLLVRWLWAYATSPAALFVLTLAMTGFFSCFCQWIVMRSVQAEAPQLANRVGDFANEVVNTLEGVSQKWADDANGVILGFTNEVNQDMLGYVVNATSAVNATLNTFTQEISKGIDAVFGGTVLDNTVQQVVRCLIGIKVDAVEKGLTWVHDNAQISLPLFPNDTFAVGAQKSIDGDSDLTSFLASPSSVTTDEITGAVDSLIDHLREKIVREALIATGLLLVYIIVVLGGTAYTLVGMVTPDRTRGDGGARHYTGDGRTPPESPRARFPRFDDGQDGFTPVDRYAAAAASASGYPNEKQPYPVMVNSGKGMKSPGHTRDSSYGHLEDVRI